MSRFGYHGRILHAYLSELRLDVETPDESFYRKYGGGSALGLYYLLRHTPPSSHSVPAPVVPRRAPTRPQARRRAHQA